MVSEVGHLNSRIMERLGAAFHSLDVFLTSLGTVGVNKVHNSMVLIPAPVANNNTGIFDQNSSAIAFSESVLLPLVPLLPFTEGTALLLRLIWSFSPTHFPLITAAFHEGLVKFIAFDVFSSLELVAQSLHIFGTVFVVLLDVAGLAAFNLREVAIVSSRSN